MADPDIQRWLTVITARSLPRNSSIDPSTWKFGLLGGDIVEPSTNNYQLLHTDWASYLTNSMPYGYALVVSVAPRDITTDLGPIRRIPWSVLRKMSDYPDEPPFATGSAGL